jgi:hypothetical protein
MTPKFGRMTVFSAPPICPWSQPVLRVPAPRSQDMPIKYMCIVQRDVYRATVRPDAGRCQAEFCTANVVSDRHRRVWGVSDPECRGFRPIRSSRTPCVGLDRPPTSSAYRPRSFPAWKHHWCSHVERCWPLEMLVCCRERQLQNRRALP